jgi:23S rRNA (cytosine1962-C5)-methyltransferase
MIGQGLYNPRSMIAVRMVVWGERQAVTPDLFHHRVLDAIKWRQRMGIVRDAYRVVYSEADQIPGLIVDKYGPMLVVQITSLGLVPFVEAIVQALQESLNPVGIYEHGDLRVREREGLPRENRLLWGELVSPVEIREHGVRLLVDLVGGQKTGHFLDQCENRARIADLAANCRVFDAFCHTGAFGLVAAAHGAQSVVGIDIDADAIATAMTNAVQNEVADRVHFVHENAFDWLRRESGSNAQYDLGILDPPAFTKSKDTVAQALRGYKEINLRGLKLIRPGGLLVTSSCSYHISESTFIDLVQSAAHDARRVVRILEVRGQSPDHPVLPALPESRYLKWLLLAVT